MKVLIRAAAVAMSLFLLAFISLMAMVLIDSAAEANEVGDGGQGLRGVPAEFRPWILKADKECSEPEMTPALLAAQLYQESRFSLTATSDAGAQGPAQFMPGTWATWGRDSDGNGQADPSDIGDAVMAQGRMMCSLIKQARSSGYGGDVRALALAGYNAGWGAVERYQGVPPRSFAGGQTYNYVRIILSTMTRFQGPGLVEIAGSGDGAAAARKAA
ncbi:lytic transglycosylase domain-containing protein, partial [Streptomyces sp. NPDC004579]|uniref:lytic transglycosylase domain-containing protein n=1 Tax=Streptomyces sp. NPDC004579 TaxID=3154667 RepID=UPI0033A635F5